jgi:hypothetical protein
MSDMLIYRNRVYTALAPEQKVRKKQYLLEQAVGIPAWDDVWTEMKTREPEWVQAIEYEAKKRSLYGEQGYFDPPDDVVEALMAEMDLRLWKRAQKDRNAYDRLWAHAHTRMQDDFDVQFKRNMAVAEKEIKALAYQDYRRLVDQLQRAHGRPCWRALWLPLSVDPGKHEGLGVFWSTRQESAQPYFGGRSQDFPTHQLVVYEGKIDVDYVDWKGTAGAHAVTVYGERENEVRFVKHAPIFVTRASVYRSNQEWFADGPNHTISVQAVRHC